MFLGSGPRQNPGAIDPSFTLNQKGPSKPDPQAPPAKPHSPQLPQNGAGENQLPAPEPKPKPKVPKAKTAAQEAKSVLCFNSGVGVKAKTVTCMWVLGVKWIYVLRQWPWPVG